MGAVSQPRTAISISTASIRARFTPESIKHATDMALQLQPDLAESQIAQGSYLYRVLRDFAGAERSFAAVLEKSPGNGMRCSCSVSSSVARAIGIARSSISKQVATLDPRNVGLMVAIGGETLSNLRRFDEARNGSIVHSRSSRTIVDGHLQGDTAMLGGPARRSRAYPRSDCRSRTSIRARHGGRVYLRLLQRRNDDAIAEAKALLARPEDALEGLATRSRSIAASPSAAPAMRPRRARLSRS